MKFQKFTVLSFVLMVFSITSCSSEDSPAQEQEQEINPANQKLTSITFPSSFNLAYMMDKQELKYDDLKRLSLNGVVEIKYVNDELIETNLLEENISNIDLEAKTYIKLKDKNIVSVISNRIFKKLTGEVYSIERDSTAFTYENEYLSKVVTYFKQSGDYGEGKYRLEKQLDFQVTNGNITQIKTSQYGDSYITNYTYDSSPNIPMNDFGYETPLHKIGIDRVLVHDKIGKKNANNIVSIENVFNEVPFQRSYKTINFKRNLDKFGRITEILLSGTCVTSNPNSVASNFTDEKLIFEYK